VRRGFPTRANHSELPFAAQADEVAGKKLLRFLAIWTIGVAASSVAWAQTITTFDAPGAGTDSGRWLLRMFATRSCVCDCPASTTRPDLPSHWQYPTRYGDSVTTRLEALGQCIPPSQDGYRNREGTIFLPASRRIGARVSGRVSRCEPL